MNPELRHRLGSYPGFYASMGALAALALVAGVVLAREQAGCRRAGRVLEAGRRELAKASAVANASVEVEVGALRAELERARAELFGPVAEVGEAGTAPAGRIEAYADITGFVERNRARAQAVGVALAADERFGFGQFAREGPALGEVSAVWKQRMALERPLEALWAARPQALAAVWLGGDAAAGGRGVQPPGIPGLVDARGCGVSFIGDTASLRRYLPVLAGLEAPVVVVRELRVEPLPVDAKQAAGSAPSKFTLTLELLSPVGPEVPVTARLEPALPGRTWAPPRAQAAGAGWVFEVFGSPAIEYAKDRRDWRLAGAGAAAVAAEAKAVELVEVRRLHYRWRLVGHGGAGGADGGWVVLEDTVGGRTVRLRRGGLDEAGALALEEWMLVRTPAGQWVAEALVRGADAVVRRLTEGVNTPGPELVAVLREGGQGARVEGIAGATVRVGAGQYRIDGVAEAPAWAEVTRMDGPAKPGAKRRLEPVRR